MQKQKFISQLREVMELDDDVVLTEDTDLRSLKAFDSLAILSIIALIDEHFDKRLVAKQFQAVTTVNSLISVIGDEHFK